MLSAASWVVTVPKTVKWIEYQRELLAVVANGAVLNFRVHGFPKDMRKGDRCYVVHDGQVRGWMRITDLTQHSGFTCTTTGREWPAGKYIQRSGEFHPIDGPKLKGFRGVRRYE